MRYATDASGAKRVTVIPGDGIGPEVIGAAMRVVDAGDQALFQRLSLVASDHRRMHVERLLELDGKPAFTRAQRED